MTSYNNTYFSFSHFIQFFLLTEFAALGVIQTRGDWFSLMPAVYSAHSLRGWFSNGCCFVPALVRALIVHTGANESRTMSSALNSVQLRAELDSP